MPNDNLKISSITPADLDDVYIIETSTFPDPWPYAIFISDLEDPQTFCWKAKIEKKLVAFIIFRLENKTIHLTNIAVKEDFRRKKVGHRLLKKLLYKAREYKSEYIYLDVRKSNQAAIDFYRRYGFEVLLERKGYYRRPPEDALVMVLQMTERSDRGVVQESSRRSDIAEEEGYSRGDLDQMSGLQ